MSHPNALKNYQQVETQAVLNTTPHQLILKLFDGVLIRLAAARGHIDRREIAAKGEALGKAISIIGGLRGSLNHIDGGEIAANLEGIYEYCERQLIAANVENDIKLIDEVVGLLREVRAAWVEIPSDLHSQTAEIPQAATAS